MKKTSRLCVIVAAALVIATVLSGCVSLKHIEDTNGEDTSLCRLTDDELTANRTQSLAYRLTKKESHRKLRLSVEKLSGVMVLCRFRAREDASYLFDISPELNAGNLRLYFWCDGEIIQDIALDGAQSVTISGLNGACELRAAAESASFSVRVAYEVLHK